MARRLERNEGETPKEKAERFRQETAGKGKGKPHASAKKDGDQAGGRTRKKSR